MNPTDFYDLQLQLSGNRNTLFQIWLGFTFATTVAFHLAGTRLNLFLLILVEFMYVLASYVFAMKWLHAASIIVRFNQTLVEAGHEPLPSPTAFVFWSQFSLFAIGTLATFGYGIYTYRNKGGAT